MDAIVIGSGAGGLTTALALARAGKKVTVFEQHYLPGGWCHSFDLGGYQFSPGVHYVGAIGPGGFMRNIYEGLGVANDLTWLELNPDGYDHVLVDGYDRFDIPKGREVLTERLVERFPHEAAGIRAYMDAMYRMSKQLFAPAKIASPVDALLLPWNMRTVLRSGWVPLSKYVDRFVSDPHLKAILTIQAGDHGMGPDRCPTAVHASIVGHYFNGGYYPKGGGRAIPKAFIKALRRHGGQIKVRTGVDRILVEKTRLGGHRVVGVRLDDGTEVRAPIVVTNADPGITFGKLLPEEAVPWGIRRKLRKTTWSISSLSLFMATDMDLRAAGMDSGNYWWSRTPRIQDGYDLATAPTLEGTQAIPGSFLTATTLKDPTKRRDGVHTMESFCFVSNASFQRFASSRYGDRPEGYAALKEELADRMLAALDHIVPDLSKHIVFRELGTPLTNVHYCAATEGNLYGIEKTLMQSGPFGFPIKTSIGGLYQCGASTIGHGVAGATLSGLEAARQILGVRTSEILSEQGQTTTILPCDAPETWASLKHEAA